MNHVSFNRMVTFILCLLLVGAFDPTTKSTAQTQPATARPDSYVVIISIDRLPPDYYNSPGGYGLRIPNLTRMKLEGASAAGVIGIYPRNTYPAHTTIVSGVRPAKHGIVQNRIFEPPDGAQTRDWHWFAKAIKSETLWSVAKKAGLTTAGVSWPVTVGADIDYNIPEFWVLPETPTLAGPSPRNATPGLVEKIVASLPVKDPKGDEWRTAAAESIITTYRPRLLLIHLLELDHLHHTYGPGSPQGLESTEREDSYVGRIIEAPKRAGVFEKTTFFVVSDHGFGRVEKRYTPGVTLVKEKLVTLDSAGKPTSWKAAVWPGGGSCAIMLRDPKDKATADKVADIFLRMSARSGSPINRIVTRQEMDKLGAIPEAALMLEAASGFTFGEGYTGEEVRDSGDYHGTHGYLPSR